MPRSFVRLLLAATLVLTVHARGDDPPFKGLEKLPPPETGVINGELAILVAPVDKESLQVLDPKGCQITIEPHEGEEFRYLTYPCGGWFQPPRGRYDMWLDGPGYVSDLLTVFSYGGGPAKGGGSRALENVVPSGRIRAKTEASIPAGARSLRVLSLRDQWLAFQRVIPSTQAMKGVNVPAGRVVAGYFLPTGEAIALSRPFEVKAGGTAEFVPAPTVGHDVLFVLDKNGHFEPASRPDLKVFATSGSKKYAPDVLLDSSDVLIGIWYGVKEDSLSITVDPFLSEPRRMTLKPGKVTTLRVSGVAQALHAP